MLHSGFSFSFDTKPCTIGARHKLISKEKGVKPTELGPVIDTHQFLTVSNHPPALYIIIPVPYNAAGLSIDCPPIVKTICGFALGNC
jgi:hypothetical protein